MRLNTVTALTRITWTGWTAVALGGALELVKGAPSLPDTTFRAIVAGSLGLTAVTLYKILDARAAQRAQHLERTLRAAPSGTAGPALPPDKIFDLAVRSCARAQMDATRLAEREAVTRAWTRTPSRPRDIGGTGPFPAHRS